MSIFTTTRNILGLYNEGKPAQQAVPKKEKNTQAKKNVEAFRRNLERGKTNLEEKQIKEKQEILRQAENILNEIESFSKTLDRKEVKEVVKTQQSKKEIIKKEKVDAAQLAIDEAKRELEKLQNDLLAIGKRDSKIGMTIGQEIEMLTNQYSEIKTELAVFDILAIYKGLIGDYKQGLITRDGLSDDYIRNANVRLEKFIKSSIKDEKLRNQYYEKFSREIAVQEEVNDNNDAISRLSANDVKSLASACKCRETLDEDIETVDEYGNIVSANYYDDEYLDDEVFYSDSQYDNNYDDEHNNDFNNYNDNYNYNDYNNDCDDANILEARLKLISDVQSKLSSTSSDDWSAQLAYVEKYGQAVEVKDVYEIESL